MFRNAKTVAFIGARAGSKRFPGKNKAVFYGKPLICWTIERALRCDFINEVVVSTDDKDILKICIRYFDEYPNHIKIVQRPVELAQDNSFIVDAIKDAFKNQETENIVIILLQPTSPLCTQDDICMAYATFEMGMKRFPVVSAYWEFPMKEIKLNGAIYIDWYMNIIKHRGFIRKSGLYYLMPKERSIDIDFYMDFYRAELEMKKRLKNDI